MPDALLQAVRRRPSRSSRSSHRSRRSAILLLTGVALVVSALSSPVAARQASAKTIGGWSSADRSITERHLPSARAAGHAALADPRSHAKPVVRARPTVSLQHPAAPGNTPVAGTTSSPAPRSATQAGPTAAGPTPQIIAPPDVAATQTFAGLAQAESGNFYPPDPWVAVSATYVVQSVNSMIRITNRLGTEISTIPVWSLFALPADQLPTDPRILWDATHGRWVAIAASFRSDDALDYMNLAVSDSADPTAGWSIYALAYDHKFPDYPSVASSNDKIVITQDVFNPTFDFLYSELSTFTWASILGGASVVHNECFAPVYIHPRAAQVLSPTNDVHLVVENAANPSLPPSEQVYFRLVGAGNCDLGQVTDGTDFAGFPAFALPPDPRQTGDTIAGAIDERPTDAIWKNGQLFWVSTFPKSHDGNVTFVDAVAIWHASTVASGLATEVGQVFISAPGVDDFMGGIGMTRDDNLVVVYSESSPSSLISMRALRVPPGGSIDDSILIDASDATYASERWGDFAGVAMDPVGTGAVWATHEVAAADGTWRTTVTRLVVDGDIPTTPGPLTTALVSPTGLGGSPAVRLAWPPSTDTASGTVRYQVAQSIDGLPFGTVSNVAGTSTVRPLTLNHTYQFAVRAVDAVGTAGNWRVTPAYRNYLYQSTSSTVVTGSWKTTTSSSFSGGSTRYANAAGASATFTASSARAIAIVTTKAASRGSFKVYVDGAYKGTISTYSATTRFRQIVFQANWASPGTHKIKIVVSGTAGHPRVDLDAFVVLR